jgi:hypothetical protein
MFKLGSINFFFQTQAELELITKLNNLFKLSSLIFQTKLELVYELLN